MVRDILLQASRAYSPRLASDSQKLAKEVIRQPSAIPLAHTSASSSESSTHTCKLQLDPVSWRQ
eukprot:2639229-Amphidinium_carterae.1